MYSSSTLNTYVNAYTTFQDLMDNKQWPLPPYNETFDCVIHIETELPKGEKSGEKYDALSLIIIELNYSSHRDGRKRGHFSLELVKSSYAAG